MSVTGEVQEKTAHGKKFFITLKMLLLKRFINLFKNILSV